MGGRWLQWWAHLASATRVLRPQEHSRSSSLRFFLVPPPPPPLFDFFRSKFASRPVHNDANMAEVLGAVASGLAIAEVGLKVGGTVWKLRRLWQQVHEVPETIQDLMRQIEMMDPILSDHEANLAIHSTAPLRHPPVYNAASAIQSAAYCREALGDLRRLVDDLDGAVESEKRSRRTLARMRVMLKKDTIKGFQDRLERAIRLLQWAQVNYLA